MHLDPSVRRIAILYAVACLGPLGAAALRVLLSPTGGGALAITARAMAGPLLGTVCVQLWSGEAPLRNTGARPRITWWWLAAVLMPLLIAWAALGISPLLSGVELDWSIETLFTRLETTRPPEELAAARAQVDALPVHPVFLSIPSAVLAGLTINAVAGFGEKIGGRGWLERELAPLGLWRSAGITGALWGLWHAPLILLGHSYPEHPAAGRAMRAHRKSRYRSKSA